RRPDRMSRNEDMASRLEHRIDLERNLPGERQVLEHGHRIDEVEFLVGDDFAQAMRVGHDIDILAWMNVDARVILHTGKHSLAMYARHVPRADFENARIVGSKNLLAKSGEQMMKRIVARPGRTQRL